MPVLVCLISVAVITNTQTKSNLGEERVHHWEKLSRNLGRSLKQRLQRNNDAGSSSHKLVLSQLF